MTRDEGNNLTPQRPEADPEAPLWPRAVLEAYHEPPATPRAQMWARIEAARRANDNSHHHGVVIPLRRRVRPLTWAAGIAALLVLGIGLGRMSVRNAQEVAVGATAELAPEGGMAYAIAATQHLAKVETFLTGLRTGTSASETFIGQARDLLLSTRLLLDSPAAEDVRLRSLFEDLELILVQVVQLGDGRRQEELELINDGLEERLVLPRIRIAIPSGPIRT